ADSRGPRAVPSGRARGRDRPPDRRGLQADATARTRSMGGGCRPADHRQRALVTRGEVWWGEDPDAGRRPLLILTRASAVPVLQSLVVVPATRTIRGIPTEVVVDEDDGMPARS